VEIWAVGAVRAGRGLGSSGTFTVGLLRALHASRQEVVTNVTLAEEACRLEIELLAEPIGKQDQYVAALGGLTAFEFQADDAVEVRPVPVPEPARYQLEGN